MGEGGLLPPTSGAYALVGPLHLTPGAWGSMIHKSGTESKLKFVTLCVRSHIA
jgi:hypothetical protein